MAVTSYTGYTSQNPRNPPSTFAAHIPFQVLRILDPKYFWNVSTDTAPIQAITDSRSGYSTSPISRFTSLWPFSTQQPE